MILIYSEQENVHVGLSPKVINGVHRHYRSYRADGHTLAVDDDDEVFVAEDAEEILTLPGFRLASASEQEAYTKAQASGKDAIKENKSK